MSFSISSKFIGSKKLLGEQVIPARALTKRGWYDCFSTDTISGAGPLDMWTRTTVAGGAAAYVPEAWTINLSTGTANADEVTLLSISSFQLNYLNSWVAETTARLQIKIFNWSNTTPAVGDQLLQFGLYTDATHYILMKNVGVSTWQIAINEGAGEAVGATFTWAQPENIRMEITGCATATPTVSIYNGSGALMSAFTDAAVPVASALHAYVHFLAVDFLDCVTCDLHSVEFELI